MQDDAPSAPAGNRSALLLILARDPEILQLEQYLAHRAGFEVVPAIDGVEGLQRARALRPDLVVSEVLVPGLDGLSLCRALKSDPQTRRIPILILSVLSVEKRAREAGADAFQRKPVEGETLIRIVRRLLNKGA